MMSDIRSIFLRCTVTKIRSAAPILYYLSSREKQFEKKLLETADYITPNFRQKPITYQYPRKLLTLSISNEKYHFYINLNVFCTNSLGTSIQSLYLGITHITAEVRHSSIYVPAF